MRPAGRSLMQELPFPGQTDHNIELIFGSAKAQIRYKMDTKRFFEFIKDDKLNSLGVILWGVNMTVRTNLLGR